MEERVKPGKEKGRRKVRRHSVPLGHNIIQPSIGCFQGYLGEVDV